MSRLAFHAGSAALILRVGASAQPPPSAPCSTSEARRLDFWIGERDLRREGDTGTNSVAPLFGECAIVEDFVGEMPWGTFRGHGVSVYDPARGKRRQTWIIHHRRSDR